MLCLLTITRLLNFTGDLSGLNIFFNFIMLVSDQKLNDREDFEVPYRAANSTVISAGRLVAFCNRVAW